MIHNYWTGIASIGGIETKYKVEGMPDYDLDDEANIEQFNAIQRKIEEGAKHGGVNFEHGEDLYTVQFKCVGIDFGFDEEEE